MTWPYAVPLLIAHGLVTLPFLILGIAFLRGARARWRREEAIWARHASDLSPDAAPSVLIQLPVFNEPSHVAQSIDAMVRLRWPKDRLRIQILDDSTDETTERAEEAVRLAESHGYRVELRHRADRSGFKAGALAHGLVSAPETYVAIFDVDYVPPEGWLEQSIAVLERDPAIAFVQSRIDFANRDASWLTRAQGQLLDGHYIVEQTARELCGIAVPFNGTCGVWRRAAIEDAGGWKAETIVEDMDLSYRVAEKGWRSTYLVSLPVHGELPERLSAWGTQQKRWSVGTIQVILLLARRIFSGAWTRGKRGVVASLGLHLLDAFYGPINLLVLLSLIGVAMAGDFDAWAIGLTVLLYISGSLRLFWLPLAGDWLTSGRVRYWRYLVGVGGAIALGLALALIKVTGFVVALSGGGKTFERTPKDAGRPSGQSG